MDIVILVCNDGELLYNKEVYSTYFDSDNFLSQLVKYPKNMGSTSKNDSHHEKYYTHEDVSIVKSIINSIRFNKLIVYDDISLEYLLEIAKMWCINDSIINEIEKKIEDKIQEKMESKRNEPILLCSICKTGFKQSENTSTSCKTHDIIIGFGFFYGELKWKCCAKPVINEDNFCRVGYHVLE